MAKGRKTGGRQKGTPNKNGTSRLLKLMAAGQLPDEFMLEIMRDANNKYPDSMRLEAAKAVAPYIHPRLQTVHHEGKDGGDLIIKIQKFADD